MQQIRPTHFVRFVACTLAFVCVGAGIVQPIPAERFLDRARFDQARTARETRVDRTTCASVRGALVNHHALASDLLRGLFMRLRTCRPDLKRIVILSPDHFFQGRTSITTGSVRYAWKNASVSSDGVAVDRLVRSKIATSDPRIFQAEHGVGALMPFLIEAFPHVTIVPIVIRPDIPMHEAERLSAELKTLLDKDTLLLVSSDFSHYLPERIAFRKDTQTLRALHRSTLSFFWTAKDDHLDFGKGLWIALRALNPTRFEVVAHSISSRYGGPSAYTTTYVTGMWR